MNRIIEMLLELIKDMGPQPIRIKVPIQQERPWDKKR